MSHPASITAKPTPPNPRPQRSLPPLFPRREPTSLASQSRWLSALAASLKCLARAPEHDLAHIHLLRLADGECDCPRE